MTRKLTDKRGNSRPSPAEVIASASGKFGRRNNAEAILAALREAGYVIEDSNEYIFANLGPGMTTEELRARLYSKRRPTEEAK
jgi:hypothetical protein